MSNTGFISGVMERLGGKGEGIKGGRERRQGGYEALEAALMESKNTSTGVSVTQATALQFSAVFACIRILGEDVASLPLLMYERQGETKHRAPDHYLYPMLHGPGPNEEMDSFDFIETLQGHLAGWGNAYAWIDYDEWGKVKELWPLNPGSVLATKREGGRRFYQYQLPDGKIEWYDGINIWHLRGFGPDGLMGYSPIRLMRQTIGLGMAAEEFGGRFFANDARPGIVMEHPGKLSPNAEKNLKESWLTEHGGLSKKHKIAILEEGLKIHEVGIPPEDAQFLQTRRFQVEEIARIFRMPPHMLADLERATFSNIEHMSIGYVIYTLRPWLVRWEQRIIKDLLVGKEQKQFFAEFKVDGLLRGDTLSRYQAYMTGKQGGWLSTNDIRELENMAPVEGGDVYWMPLNVVAAGDQGEVQGEGESANPRQSSRIKKGKEGGRIEGIWVEREGKEIFIAEGEEKKGIASQSLAMTEPKIEERQRAKARERHRLMKSYRRLFLEAAKRVLKREVNDVRAAGEKYLRRRDRNQFERWLAEFYEGHKEFTWRQFKPLLDSYGDLIADAAWNEIGDQGKGEGEAERLEAFINSYAASFAGREAGTSENKIRAAIQAAIEAEKDELEALNAELEGWTEERAGTIADEESVRSNNAVAVAVYGMGGILRLMSVAFGENCPYCTALNGRIIGIDNFFIAAGKDFQPEGVDRPLTSADNLRHAPYHGGCDCMTVAA